MLVDWHALSDRGTVRTQNEDSYLVKRLRTDASATGGSQVEPDEQATMMVVADGMGGAARGGVASDLVVRHFAVLADDSNQALLPDSTGVHGVRHTLTQALRSCHARLCRKATCHADYRGMGTTATVAILAWPRLLIAHVGDSRAYVLRNRKLKQLTRDHSMAQFLVEQGHLNSTEATTSPHRHQLWNVLGGSCKALEVEFHDVQLRAGDTVLLCTDGLMSGLNDRQIRHQLRDARDASDACSQLVAAANAAGGSDNVTCIVAQTQKQRKSAALATAFSSLSLNAGAFATNSQQALNR